MTSHISKGKTYSDAEVIASLQSKDNRVENWFYSHCEKYFNQHFNDIFFDKDRKQEIFQTAFLKLWTEITDKKITVVEGTSCRQQRNGEYKPLTCQLTTFFMAFAKTEFRELVRSNRLDTFADVYDDVEMSNMITTVFDTTESIDEQKNRIVDDCIGNMSPRCTEILTLFYLENKSLDEIMEIRKDKSSSKDGLKTAKNKCMNTLRGMIKQEFQRYGLSA